MLKIYYLDDDTELLEMFADLFSSSEVEVTIFDNAKEAIEAIHATPPDIFFIDYRLQNTTGDKVAMAVDPSIVKVLITGELDINCGNLFNLILKKPYKSINVREFIDQFSEAKK